jgi:dipeptidyl aminopeptidase/acylaminoacyl peptidase
VKYIALVAALSFLTTAAVADARTIQASDFQNIVHVSGITISPDGTRVAAIVGHVKFDEDTIRTLTYDRKGLSDPAFSPDGTKIAFIADAGTGDDAQSQIWVMPLDGGDARPVTTAPEGVDQFAWRPDGEAFAYAAEDEKPKPKGADKYRDSFVFTNEPITSRSEPRPAHLFVVPASGGKARQLTTGPESVATGEAASTIEWTPDRKAIVFVLTPNAILNDADRGHVAVVDVESGKVSALTGHTGFEADPHVSPNGKLVAYAYSTGDNQINLTEAYVTALGAGAGSPVSHALDRAIHAAAWLPDSSGLYLAYADRTASALSRISLSGAVEHIDLGDLEIRSPLDGAIAKNGTMVFAATSVKSPGEIYARSAAGVVTKLTSYNDAIAQLDLATPETIEFASPLGQTADAVVLKPPGFVAGKKYPLVLDIHGGPTSSSTVGFDFFGQLMAARGWLVLRPNYRGSDNLGLTYQRGVLYDAEEGPGKDIMAAIDAVRAKGIVDDNRIAVSGWSYGGIMTAWMISKYHIFKAAVSGASVNDWSTDYGVADDSDSDRALFHGSPYVGDASDWRKASAISYASQVTTPVLILSDVGDNRDPFATSSMYWRALRDNHKDATLRVWPVNGHFPGDPVRQLDVYEKWIDYIATKFGS